MLCTDCFNAGYRGSWSRLLNAFRLSAPDGTWSTIRQEPELKKLPRRRTTKYRPPNPKAWRFEQVTLRWRCVNCGQVGTSGTDVDRWQDYSFGGMDCPCCGTFLDPGRDYSAAYQPGGIMGLLPTKPTPPKDDIGQVSMLLYGAPKIGKSTLASQAPGALFLATEPGLDALETFQVPIDSWAKLQQVLGELAGGGHDFRTIVIDTIDNAAQYCKDHVCRQLGVRDPGDLGFGKGYAAVNREWSRLLTKLLALPYGVIFISHAKEVDEEDDRGRKLTAIKPTLGGKLGEIAKAAVNVIAFATIDRKTGARVLRTRPDGLTEAGCRGERLPDPLPMDWDAIAAAYRDPAPPHLRALIKEALRTKHWSVDQVTRLLHPWATAAEVPVVHHHEAAELLSKPAPEHVTPLSGIEPEDAAA